MWQALKDFMEYMEDQTSKELTTEEKEKLNIELQTKIGYFQH